MIDKFIKSSIFSSICFSILGLLLLLKSELTIISISYVIGAILVAIGVLAVLKFINKKTEKNELDIIYGVVAVVLGIVVITNPKAIGSIIPFVIGIIIIINSVTKLQYGLDLKKKQNELWKTTVILSIITTVFGILLIFNPFKGAEILTKIVGGLILGYSILDIITTLTIKKTFYSEESSSIVERVTEAEIVEEKTINEKKEG